VDLLSAIIVDNYQIDRVIDPVKLVGNDSKKPSRIIATGSASLFCSHTELVVEWRLWLRAFIETRQTRGGSSKCRMDVRVSSD